MHGVPTSRVVVATLLAGASCTAPVPAVPAEHRVEPGAESRSLLPRHEVVFENLDGLVVVPLRFDGIDRTLQFVLDTGAPSVISEQLADELHLQGTEHVAASDAANVEVMVEPIVIPALHVGSFTMERVSALIAPLPSFETLCRPIDGILGVGLSPGSGFLDRVAIEIDYPKQRVAIASSGAFADEDGARLPLRRSHLDEHGNRVVGTSSEVELIAEGKRGWAVLDTGSRSPNSMSAALFQALGRSLGEDDLHARTGVLRQTLSGLQRGVRREGRMKSLRVGNLELADVPIMIEESGAADFSSLLLASEFLRNFRLVVDHPAGEATLIPYAGLDPRRRRVELGFEWLEIDGKVEVVSLLDDGPAAGAGLRLGDELLDIAGVELTAGDKLGQCEARQRTRATTGTIPIRVRRDGTEAIFGLQKAEPDPID
jgi:predicted aspartyl protease